MSDQVVQEHYMPLLERGRQEVLHLRFEHEPVGGPLYYHRLAHRSLQCHAR